MSDAEMSDRQIESRIIGGQRADPAAIRERLHIWLKGRFPAGSQIDLPLPVAPDKGGSSESFFIDPVITIDGQSMSHSLMVRLEPQGHRIYEQPSIDRQFGVMQALGRIGAAPVPEALWFEPDPLVLGAPFLVMRKVDGEVPNDRYHAEGLLKHADPAGRRAICLSSLEALAGIHGADPREFAFLDRPRFGADPLDQEIAVWDSYVRWLEGGLGQPLSPTQQRARQWLHENRPAQIVAGLSWGDARIPNMIFAENRCRAVIDWEMVSLSGAETDLGWLIFYDWFVTEAMGVTPLEGVPDRDETLQIWSRLAGREPRHMLWHEVAAAWRFSLLRDRSLHLAGVDRMPYVKYPDPIMGRLERLTGA